MAIANRDRRGFTLTELLVVVGILVLLTAIVVPNITGRITIARMHKAETEISNIEVALEAYHADFGRYPGDVFPTEDINNNGVLDPGEDGGVDIDGDGQFDYACVDETTRYLNNRLDKGDGVINIDDLEWALKTTEHNGPYMDSIPLDPWGNKYVYYAPMDRPTNQSAYLYLADANPTSVLPQIVGEDTNENGILDEGEDIGIATYNTSDTHVAAGFTSKRAGAGNGILDPGDDDNKDGTIQTFMTHSPLPIYLEYGNADVSPDGLARNLGYYLYSVGRNKRDETATGYEDINLNSILNDGSDVDTNPYVELDTDGGSPSFDEDMDGDGTLDTGYEDTGIDGIPGTKDRGENDGQMTVTDPDPSKPDEEFGTISTGPTTWHYNMQHTTGDLTGEGFDIGGDDINSWNKERPWREHPSYGG